MILLKFRLGRLCQNRFAAPQALRTHICEFPHTETGLPKNNQFHTACTRFHAFRVRKHLFSQESNRRPDLGRARFLFQNLISDASPPCFSARSIVNLRNSWSRFPVFQRLESLRKNHVLRKFPTPLTTCSTLIRTQHTKRNPPRVLPRPFCVMTSGSAPSADSPE